MLSKGFLKTTNPIQQEEKIRKMAEYSHDCASYFSIYSPMALYAANKKVDFVPYKSGFLRLKETSLTDRHWSVAGKNN